MFYKLETVIEEIKKIMKNTEIKLNYLLEEEGKIIDELSSPNYSRCNVALPKNATVLEKSKYKLCKQILVYKQDNNLTIEQLAQRISLTIPETESILFARINEFTLDRLITYASNLFPSLGITTTQENNE